MNDTTRSSFPTSTSIQNPNPSPNSIKNQSPSQITPAFPPKSLSQSRITSASFPTRTGNSPSRIEKSKFLHHSALIRITLGNTCARTFDPSDAPCRRAVAGRKRRPAIHTHTHALEIKYRGKLLVGRAGASRITRVRARARGCCLPPRVESVPKPVRRVCRHRRRRRWQLYMPLPIQYNLVLWPHRYAALGVSS